MLPFVRHFFAEEDLAPPSIVGCSSSHWQRLSETSVPRGRKIYEPPRYMSIPQAASQIAEIEALRSEGILRPEATLAVAVSRVGGGDDQRIVCGTLEELLTQPAEIFAEPLHSLVIVGKRLHHLEVEYAEEYAVNKETWRSVAQSVYGCSLDH